MFVPGKKQVDKWSSGIDLPLRTAPSESRTAKQIVTGTMQMPNDTANIAEAVPD